MEGPWDLMRNALSGADNAFRAADSAATGLAKILEGRLRHVENTHQGANILRKLKKELRDFDMVKGTWKP